MDIGEAAFLMLVLIASEYAKKTPNSVIYPLVSANIGVLRTFSFAFSSFFAFSAEKIDKSP